MAADAIRAKYATNREFCDGILPGVSRTFALGIRILPHRLSRTVGVTYLVCRIADTIEDDTRLAVDLRRSLLSTLDAALEDDSQPLGPLAAAGRSPSERILMEGADRVLGEFRSLTGEELRRITPWVREMISGMARSLSDGTMHQPLLADMDGLRRYCYFVAGTVGHMLTGLFQLHCKGIDENRHETLRALATNFGLALQFTNVIRDVTDDQREGRNLIPATVWKNAGIRPEQLFARGFEKESWSVIEPLLDEAARYLGDAFAYASALPRSAIRVRLFCFSQLFFACRTLALVRSGFPRMARGVRVKMPRAEIYGLSLLTLLVAPFNGALARIFRALSAPQAGATAAME